MRERIDAQLLAQFPGQTLCDRFTRFEFAAREFPQTALVRIGMASLQQDTPLVIDQRGSSDVNGFFALIVAGRVCSGSHENGGKPCEPRSGNESNISKP